MSFCPTKDIHSVYLDNELPDVYKADYEKHLSECEECRNELEKLKSVRSIFQDDVESITPDKQFLDDSYQRLMIKMSYEKNSKKIKKPLLFRVGYAVSAAAAAVLFAVFIPMGLNSKQNNNEVVTPAIINNLIPMHQFGNNISFGSGKNTALSGNMDRGMLSSGNYMNYIDYNYNNFDLYSNVSFGGENCNSTALNLFDYTGGIDVFQPGFVGDNIVSIRVTVPGVDFVPFDLNNTQQGMVLSGNYLWNLLEN